MSKENEKYQDIIKQLMEVSETYKIALKELVKEYTKVNKCVVYQLTNCSKNCLECIEGKYLKKARDILKGKLK